ncbi:MAG: hypothetical protein JNL70_21060 [Saprospiraceae bacterium]|nr:hypothetical protein [Saprospiraceae bacterium]
MNRFKTLLSEDHNLLITNFTNPDTMMEDKKGGNINHGSKSLQDLKKELQELTNQEALKFTGGKTLEKDKWKNTCGGIVPQ